MRQLQTCNRVTGAYDAGMTKAHRALLDAAKAAGVEVGTKLNAAELAQICGVHPSTVQRSIASGDLPARRRGLRGHLMISVPDAVLYFAGRKAA